LGIFSAQMIAPSSGRLGLLRIRMALLAFLLFAMTPLPALADNAGLWQSLNTPGHFAIMRHALAPGTGDPAEFTLDDCRTQRNLSAEGRTQAERIGIRFRANGIESAEVFSSQWCRCLETARLLGLGTVVELPVINSFFRKRELEASRTAELKDWLTRRTTDTPTVLVTHQVNITALTGVFPASGELVFVHVTTDGNVSVTGTIRTD
jgi:phosphohistidine phosphatase SixA